MSSQVAYMQHRDAQSSFPPPPPPTPSTAVNHASSPTPLASKAQHQQNHQHQHQHQQAPPGISPAPGMDRRSEDEEHTRGRRRSRDKDDDPDTHMSDGDGGRDHADGEGRSRKRRRSRKGLDKKFLCPFPDCTKSYSRAEHLHRHELNHNPKQQYYCDFTGCDRKFVRQDLCMRHKERHAARGSQLQKKDAFYQNAAAVQAAAAAAQAAAAAAAGDGNVDIKREGDLDGTPSRLNGPTSVRSSNDSPFTDQKIRHQSATYTSPIEGKRSTLSPTSNASSNTMIGSGSVQPDGPARMHFQQTADSSGRSIIRSNSDASDVGSRMWSELGGKSRSMTMSSSESMPQRSGSMNNLSGGGAYVGSPPHQNTQFARPGVRNSSSGSYGMSQQYSNNIPHSHNFSNHHAQHDQSSMLYNNQGHYSVGQSFVPTPLTLPPPHHPTPSPLGASRPSSIHGGAISSSVMDPSALIATMTNVGMVDAMPSYVPVFGGEGYSRSPANIPDDFAVWLGLMNDPSFNSPLGRVTNAVGGFNPFLDHQWNFTYDDNFQQQPIPQQHPMSIPSMLDQSAPESLLSDHKRGDLLCFIDSFLQRDSPTERIDKDVLGEPNRDEDDKHVLSLKMMQNYISSFWQHFHPQLPIMHEPTFAADKSESLLLLAMMTIGASCLDKRHSDKVAQDGAILAQTISWHLRWEIFNHQDFNPPAQLWVFQALILLEVYEKMYSTRTLHERAHIHHATTITLIRRGSSLLGRATNNSPPSDDEGGARSGAHSDSSTFTSGSTTPEGWWKGWIQNEATRRAAFAAFILDATHATMFGHSAVMVAHEMRLPLPCDEGLWSATSAIEVGRIDASLNARGIKPTNFLESLKKTLSGQPVQTNSFGRMVLMAGLLSVNYHMHQRDLQISSIGGKAGLGASPKWRGSLTKAIDHWLDDYNNANAGGHHYNSTTSSSSDPSPLNPTFPTSYSSSSLHDDSVFEGRTVLHHLAHMAMHVDIVDCQIFARASRLLGRKIGPQDYKAATRRMKELWAQSARARDAAFYALRFLRGVLMPTSASARYKAREDFLLNRPWVLYFAALVTWCYGFALEGKIEPAPRALDTAEDQLADMQAFLMTIEGIDGPADLQKLSGRNRCVGLLMVVRDMFVETRWELLKEAAKLLGNCVAMLEGRE